MHLASTHVAFLKSSIRYDIVKGIDVYKKIVESIDLEIRCGSYPGGRGNHSVTSLSVDIYDHGVSTIEMRH